MILVNPYTPADLLAAAEVIKLKPTWLLDESGLIVPGDNLLTTIAAVERLAGRVRLIPNQARGGLSSVGGENKSSIRTFNVPHLPVIDTILAAALVGVREFGAKDAGTEATQASAIAKVLKRHKAFLQRTREYHALNAVAKGIVYDTNGTTVLYDQFDAWGLTRKSIAFNFGTHPADACDEAVEHITDYLHGSGMPLQDAEGGIVALCGATFYASISSHADVLAAYNRPGEGEFLRQNHLQTGFTYKGIHFKRMTHKLPGAGSPIIPATECAILPKGVVTESFAPGDILEAVGTEGRDFYSTQTELPHGVGISIRSQTNPIYLCAIPEVLVKGTTA